jgi:hypothetical protein
MSMQFGPGTYSLGTRALILLILLSFVLAPLSIPRSAEAQIPVSVNGGPGTLAEGKIVTNTLAIKLGTIKIAELQGSLVKKEYIIDTIVHVAVRLAIQQLTQSIVRWINSGFQGKPGFVTDLKGFMLDIADKTAGSFIYGSELGFLCQGIDLRIVLNISYQQARNGSMPQCTLTGIAGNVQGALQRFSTLSNFVQFALVPSNSFMGAYITAEGTLARRLAQSTQSQQKKLDWGKGFLSLQRCTQSTGADGATSEQCKDVTPAEIVRSELVDWLGTSKTALAVADEISEATAAILGALLQQLVTQASGLLGAGSASSGYGSGYGGGFGATTASGEPLPPECYGLSILDQMSNPRCVYGAEGEDVTDGLSAQLDSYRRTQLGIARAAAGTIRGVAQVGATCASNLAVLAQASNILNDAGGVVVDLRRVELRADTLQEGLNETNTTEDRIRILNTITDLAIDTNAFNPGAGIEAEIEADDIRDEINVLNQNIGACVVTEELDEEGNVIGRHGEDDRRETYCRVEGAYLSMPLLNGTPSGRNFTACMAAAAGMSDSAVENAIDDVIGDITERIYEWSESTVVVDDAPDGAALVANQLIGLARTSISIETIDIESETATTTLVGNQTLTSRLSASGLQCPALINTPQTAARTESSEKGYVFFKDQSGNYRIADITKSSSAARLEYDEGLLNEAASRGTDLHIVHTHPRSTLQTMFGVPLAQKGPSSDDYAALCANSVTKRATHIAADGASGKLWRYKLKNPTAATCAPLQNPASLGCLDALALLRGVPSTMRQEAMTGARAANPQAAQCLSRVEQNLSDAGILSAMQSLADSAGITLEEIDSGQFCSTKQNGLST